MPSTANLTVPVFDSSVNTSVAHPYRRKPRLGKGLAEIGAGEIEEVTSPTRTREHEDGYGKPPAGRRFQKGQSGNPCGPRGKNLPALLVAR